MSWTGFLVAYLLGGITFIPLVVIAVLFHAHQTFPYRHDVQVADSEDGGIVQPGDDTSLLHAAKREKSMLRVNPQFDAACGYFAVCREYTPMGINAKPIERSTPVGSTTVAAPSQSVYQAMYKSLFERKGANSSQSENASASQRPKNAGNVFFVILRHGHLMLFDDEQQIEVRHVISLAHHDVTIYSGGGVTPEGELFIKRNALCLTRKTSGLESTPDSQPTKPFFLFSENCSAKEDFYFALLRDQEQTAVIPADAPPDPKQFNVKHVISLIEKLHSSDDNVHSRWINALIGRIFLGVYKTADLEQYIRDKLNIKISRVKRPSFLSNIKINAIDTGDAAPFFTNLRLKDLNVDGECLVDADVRYNGNFRIEVATTVKIDLGPRFKKRQVNIVLAVVVKKLEGHMLFKIKAPPSNRLWLSFQTMPKMELAIEPIVSSRQITYTVILRQIENRIKEIVAETLVQPFWDDVPFFKTEHKSWRGGIFEGDDAVDRSAVDLADGVRTDNPEVVQRGREKGEKLQDHPPLEKSHSFPVIDTQSGTASGLGSKEDAKTIHNVPASRSKEELVENDSASRHSRLDRPESRDSEKSDQGLRGVEVTHEDSGSEDNMSLNAVIMGTSNSRPGSSRNFTLSKSAASSTSSLRQGLDNPPGFGESLEDVPELTLGRHNTGSSRESLASGASEDSVSSRGSGKSYSASRGRTFFLRRENTGSSLKSPVKSVLSPRKGILSPKGEEGEDSLTPTPRSTTFAAVTQAAAQAKNWGWNALQRREAKKQAEAASQIDLTQPMGGGQPFPPVGQPLPGPNGKTKIGTFRSSRKSSSSQQGSSEQLPREGSSRHRTSSVQARRRRGASRDSNGSGHAELLVIAAPDDSEPNTPADEDGAPFSPWKQTPRSAPLTATKTKGALGVFSPSALRPPLTPNNPLQSEGMQKHMSSPHAVANYDDNEDFSGWMDEAEDPEGPNGHDAGMDRAATASSTALQEPIQSSA
ncbi:unnamed protein product [Clonostachys byssicola]|uniref:SMP-LTD domain-containing protein n=1 Tax=Clonostachys byssicola TaxID=160290 RepID=A0A9N9UGI1_9HYPO|nr:unnamed protein product [Clonostachys byssicola]